MFLSYLALFAGMFKIGLFAVGGGLATLPFIYALAGTFPLNTLRAEDIPDMLAVSQMLPGAMGINLAAYTGANISAFGAYTAVFGMITPQIIVIVLIAGIYDSFQKNKIVKQVFIGLSAAAAGLIFSAGFSVWKLSLYNNAAQVWFDAIKLREAAILITIFILIRTVKLHPAFFIAAAGVAGVVLKL
jgi:chromate transporter